VKDWEGEEQIKAQLRELTDRTRKLRQDLDELVRPPDPSPTRAFIHRHSWPKLPAAQPDRPQKRGKKR
jgi:hypothetical protein